MKDEGKFLVETTSGSDYLVDTVAKTLTAGESEAVPLFTIPECEVGKGALFLTFGVVGVPDVLTSRLTTIVTSIKAV